MKTACLMVTFVLVTLLPTVLCSPNQRRKFHRRTVKLVDGVVELNDEVVDTLNATTGKRTDFEDTVHTASGQQVWHRQYTGETFYTSVAISRDGYVAARAGGDVQIWNFEGDLVHEFTVGGSLRTPVLLSHNSSILVCGAFFENNGSSVVHVRDLVRKLSYSLVLHNQQFRFWNALLISEDGSRISVLTNTMITLVDNTAQVLASIPCAQLGGYVMQLAMTRNGRYLVGVFRGETEAETYLRILEYIPSEKAFNVRNSFIVPNIHMNGDDLIVVSDSLGRIVQYTGVHRPPFTPTFYAYNVFRNKIVQHTIGEPNMTLSEWMVWQMKLAADGTHMVASYSTRDYKNTGLAVYDLSCSKVIFEHQYPYHDDGMQHLPYGVAISPTGRYVAVATTQSIDPYPDTEELQVFDVQAQKPILKVFTPGGMYSLDMVERLDALYITIGGQRGEEALGELYLFKVSPANGNTSTGTLF